MRIDAHVHAIDHARFPYTGLHGVADPLRKDYPPAHVEHILRRNRFDGMVLVAAQDSVAETRWLLDLANANPFVAGVVGWVDLEAAPVGAALDQLEAAGRLRAVRSRVGAPGMRAGLLELARRNLPLEVNPPLEELGAVRRLAAEFPDLRIIVQHGGNPDVDNREFDPWARAMSELAAAFNVSVKVSGLVTPATQGWQAAEFAPHIRRLFDTFGPRRLLFGSDWPFCLRAVDAWKKVLAAFTQGLGPRSMEERALILGENAMELYRIPSAPEAQNCFPST